MEQQGDVMPHCLAQAKTAVNLELKELSLPLVHFAARPNQLTLEQLWQMKQQVIAFKRLFYKFELSHFGITYNTLCDWSTSKTCVFSPYINLNNSVYIRLSIKESLNGPVIAIVFNKFDYPLPVPSTLFRTSSQD